MDLARVVGSIGAKMPAPFTIKFPFISWFPPSVCAFCHVSVDTWSVLTFIHILLLWLSERWGLVAKNFKVDSNTLKSWRSQRQTCVHKTRTKIWASRRVICRTAVNIRWRYDNAKLSWLGATSSVVVLFSLHGAVSSRAKQFDFATTVQQKKREWIPSPLWPHCWTSRQWGNLYEFVNFVFWKFGIWMIDNPNVENKW